MRPWLPVAVLATVALPSPVPAQSPFDQKIAHWRISSIGTSCMAFNRPAYELNGSPFNVLSISLNKQGRWNFSVYFWPKAFARDADISLVFQFGGAKEVKALGKAADEYLVVMRDTGASFRDDIASTPKGEMSVRAEGLPAPVFFDVSDTAAVFTALAECAKTLR